MSCKLNVQIENIRIQNVTEQKLLGIYIDEHQTWSSHIYHLCSNLVSTISLLRQLSQYVSIEYQKMFYQDYILPFIDYGSVTWASATGTHIERLLKSMPLA